MSGAHRAQLIATYLDKGYEGSDHKLPENIAKRKSTKTANAMLLEKVTA